MQQLIGKVARMYPVVILMGVMIVVIALIIGSLNSQTAESYFAQSKAVRETTLTAQRAAIESTGLWLPYFKFLGIGLLLGGIVMALRVILDSLRAAGSLVMEGLPPNQRPSPPNPPWYGWLMPMVMMLGVANLIAALIVSLGLAGTARAVFAHPVPEIDAAGAGSALLAQLQTIQTTSAWLVPFKFMGIATEFLAIVMGLATILFVLGSQTEMLEKGIQIGLAAKAATGRSGEHAPIRPVGGVRAEIH